MQRSRATKQMGGLAGTLDSDTPPRRNSMDKDHNQYAEANRCANNIEEEAEDEEEYIRPSIPSIIPLKKSNRRSVNGIDDSSHSSEFSLSSLVSEVTLMTFSEEKAAMLKSEFLSRVQQETQTRPLSRDEKMALLTEIQADQDKKFKAEMQRQETKRTIDREGEKTKHEFFERLNALRVIPSAEDSAQYLPKNDNLNHVSEEQLSPDRVREDSSHSDDSDEKEDEKKKEQQAPSCRRAVMNRRRSGLGRRQSILSSSDKTEKRSNSNRSLLTKTYSHRDCTMATAAEQTAADMSSMDSNSESKSSQSTPKSTTTTRADIEELIKLKMEIANQQATIDTITARVHNLEIDNSKLASSLSREKLARTAAEKLNEELTKQLQKYYDNIKDGQSPSDAVTASVTRPAMGMKQSSTVDWGDNDGSDRSILDKLKKLEEQNEDLCRENARLQKIQERRGSNHTECTENSTYSSEQKSVQPRLPHRSRPEEGIGASLRSLGSSIKIPFTKIPRSRSAFGISEFVTLEEELTSERSPSMPTVTNDAESIDSDSHQGGVLRAHRKAQRRWSSGDTLRKKSAEENVSSSRNASRRWSTFPESDDNEEGRGGGGWLNGWKVFGKVDEEIDDGESAGAVEVKA